MPFSRSGDICHIFRMSKTKYGLARSSSCFIGAVWAESGTAVGIIRIYLFKDRSSAVKGIKKDFPKAIRGRCGGEGRLLKKVRLCLEGEKASFGTRDIVWDRVSDFQRRIFPVLMSVPRGKVITYKRLARLAGTGSARAVGGAMAKNPLPVIVPCHRVVGASRDIGGFQPGRSLKRKLLESEGIRFDRQGKILKRFFA